MGKATVLSEFHQLANSLWRFIGIDLDASLKARTTALNGSRLDRALAEETRDLLNASLLELDLCCFPGPGKLGEQSKRNTGTKVGQWRWRTVIAADPLSLVAYDCKAAPRGSTLTFTPHFRPFLLTIKRPRTHMNVNVPTNRGSFGSGSRGWAGRSLFIISRRFFPPVTSSFLAE